MLFPPARHIRFRLSSYPGLNFRNRRCCARVSIILNAGPRLVPVAFTWTVRLSGACPSIPVPFRGEGRNPRLRRHSFPDVSDEVAVQGEIQPRRYVVISKAVAGQHEVGDNGRQIKRPHLPDPPRSLSCLNRAMRSLRCPRTYLSYRRLMRRVPLLTIETIAVRPSGAFYRRGFENEPPKRTRCSAGYFARTPTSQRHNVDGKFSLSRCGTCSFTICFTLL